MSGYGRTPASKRSARRPSMMSAKRRRQSSPQPPMVIYAQPPVNPNVASGNFPGPAMNTSWLMQSSSAPPVIHYAQTPVTPNIVSKNVPGPIMKPKDVPMLDLWQLSGLEAAGRLQIFFEAVERCTDDDSSRVVIAKSRLSSELAMLIHNNQAKWKCNTWMSFCHFLKTEFAVDVNVDRAWSELEDHEYDWIFPPQAYTNKYICRHAVIETRFPQEKFPNRDRSIKRKLWQGMPKDCQRRLEAFLEEGYPLNKFIDRVEHERQILLANPSASVNHLKTAKSPPKNTSSESQEVVDLKNQVKNLTEALAKMKPVISVPPPLMSLPTTAPPNPRNPFTTPRTGTYCPCCYSTSHRLIECPTKPPQRNACFDCHRLGCRRGYPTCPGKINANRD